MRVHLRGRGLLRCTDAHVDVLLLLGANKLPVKKLKNQLIDRFYMTDMTDVSRGLDITVTHDRKEWIITVI